MKMFVSALATVVATVGLSAAVSAGPITDYTVYAGNQVSIGNNNRVTGGLVGAGQKLTVGSGSAVTGLRIGGTGDFSGGSNLVVDGDIIGADQVTLGSGSGVSGNVSGANKVTVNSNAVIGGSVTAGSLGATINSGARVDGNVSGGSVSLSSGSYVGGNVTSGGSIYAHRNATVVGTTTAWGHPANPATFAAPTMLTPTTVSLGAQDVSGSNGAALSLLAGHYDDLILANNCTLTLSAGNYYFDRFSVGNGLTLNLDTSAGAVSIIVDGDISLGNNLVSYLQGSGSVYTEAHGDWTLGNNGLWIGTVFATDDIAVGENGTIYGALYAGDRITLDNNVCVYGSSGPMAASCSSPQVPEPATMVLLGTGLGAMMVARWRKKNV